MQEPSESRPSGWAALENRSYSQTNRYPELSPLGGRQGWVLSRGQLREHGFNRHRVDHELRIGRWTQVAPTVIALQNGPLDLIQRRWVGVLHAGPSSALSHLTACLAGRLSWRGSDSTIHVITQKGDLVSPLEGYFFHQTRRRYSPWIEAAGTGPRGLALPYAVLLTAERDPSVRRAIGLLAAAVQQRLTTADELALCSTRIRKLRHGKVFRAVLGDIAGGADSFSEIEATRWCARAGLVAPTRQRRRRGADGRWRYIDLEWQVRDGRLIALEVDGSFHMDAEHWWRDIARDRQLVVAGATVLRCSTIELRLEPRAVTEDLVRMGVPRLVTNADLPRSA